MLSKQSEFSLLLSALSWTVCMLLRVSLTLNHISTTCSPFSSQLIKCNFSLILIVFCRFFIWIAQDKVDLCFSLNTKAVEGETKWATWLYCQCHQSIHVTWGMKVTSPSAIFLQKCKYRSSMLNHVKLKHTKIKCVEQELPVLKTGHLETKYSKPCNI